MQTFAVSGPRFSLKLSDWDRRFPPIYSKRILCLSLPLSSSHDQVSILLHKAMQATVQDIPFLAGSIVPLAGGPPWLRDVVPEGAAKLHLKDVSHLWTYDKLRHAEFDQALLDADELCPLPDVAYIQDDPVDVCQVQANFVEGGLLLVFSVIHCVCDGMGSTKVMESFVKNVREAQHGFGSAGAYSSSPSPASQQPAEAVQWMFDRSLVMHGSGAHGDIDKHPAWTVSPSSAHGRIVQPQVSCRTFQISSESLGQLKQIASRPSPSDSDFWISTHDAVVAFIWRSIVLARHRADTVDKGAGNANGSITYLTQPVDCRKYLDLPAPYYGNAIYGIRVGMPFTNIASIETGVSAAAHAIRGEIAAVNEDKFRDLLSFTERTGKRMHTRLKLMEDLPSRGLMVTSYYRMHLYELDFGPAFGPVDAFRLPSKGFISGMQVVFPRSANGSCDIMISEPSAVIERLLEDEHFTDIARDIPASPLM